MRSGQKPGDPRVDGRVKIVERHASLGQPKLDRFGSPDRAARNGQIEGGSATHELTQAAQRFDIEPSVSGVGNERQLSVVRHDALVTRERQSETDAGGAPVQDRDADEVVAAQVAQDRPVELAMCFDGIGEFGTVNRTTPEEICADTTNDE